MPDHTAFAELLRALARERARTLVIGGLAKRLHGEVTDAYDHCLWYDADEENAARVYRALSRVGGQPAGSFGKSGGSFDARGRFFFLSAQR